MIPATFHTESHDGKRGRRYRAVVYLPKSERRPGDKPRIRGPWRGLQREARADGQQILERLRAPHLAGASDITIAELLTRYIASRTLKPTTRQRYEHDRERVDEDKGTLRAAAVLPVEWSEYFADLQADGLGPKSVGNLRGLVHAAYRWAVRGRLLTYNPIADTEPPEIDRTKGPAPTVDRVQAALEVLTGNRLEGAAILMGAAGLRDGEAVARRWSDLDWQRVRDDDGVEHLAGGVTVLTALTQTRDESLPKGKRQVLHLGPPKSRKGKRRVPLPEMAIERLLDLKRRQMQACLLAGRSWSDDALISGRRDGSFIPPNQASSELGRLWRRAGFAEMHPHLLRHAFITELVVRQGVDAQTAADLAGHSTAATTLTYYTHTDDEAKAAAASALSGAWQEGYEKLVEAREPQVSPKKGAVVPIAAARKQKTPA